MSANKEIFLVAAVANKARNFAPFEELGALFDDSATIHYFDGASQVDGRLVATSPLEQGDVIIECMEKAEGKDMLIITHSMGMLAAMRCLELRPDLSAKAVAIAPPLPTPASVIKHPRSQKKLTAVGGEIILPSYSFAPDSSAATVPVVVSPDYFRDIETASINFSERVAALADQDRLRLISPTQDWNTECFSQAGTFKGTTYIEAPHSLYVPGNQLPIICREMFDTIVANNF